MEVYLLVYKNEAMAAYVDFEFAIDRKDDLVRAMIFADVDTVEFDVTPEIEEKIENREEADISEFIKEYIANETPYTYKNK